jgi:hypothetical protein
MGDIYRSPTQAQIERLAARHADVFGYERDLAPSSLEDRCATFFPRPPDAWRAEHLLFSSGQAAMTNVLTALSSSIHHPVRVSMHGCYFETRDLIERAPALASLTAGESPADAILIEPIGCNGAFIRADIAAIIRRAVESRHEPRALIFDSTLLGRRDGLNDALNLLNDADPPPLVVRLMSGLKLLQAGLELANVGIVSVFSRNDTDFTEDLRKLRTLTGAGLRYADLLALEAPFFLDADYTRFYEDAVFANNAAFARAAARNPALQVSHPALDAAPGIAPYCVLRPRDPRVPCEALEDALARGSDERRLVFDRGGSFGFRGHRFEIVRPETGDAPFLRVAMGRRAGWSLDGAIGLIGEIEG